jgi:hypothetical protein
MVGLPNTAMDEEMTGRLRICIRCKNHQVAESVSTFH